MGLMLRKNLQARRTVGGIVTGPFVLVFWIGRAGKATVP